VTTLARRSLLFALLLGCCATSLGAAGAYSEQAVKAAFLYRFAGYVEWPQDALPAAAFSIAVLNADDVAAKLEQLAIDHPLQNRATQVRRMKGAESLREGPLPQILYIGPSDSAALRGAIAALGARPVLIVTDDPRGLELGGAVNFLIVDRRVRFEVSLGAAQRAGLVISSELLSVAARVQGGRLRSDASCLPATTPGRVDPPCFPRLADASR
jgi:hypothetical protein